MRFFKDEKAFTRWVLKEARDRGWVGAHFGDSRRSVRMQDGSFRWVGDKDAAGFPDLVLVHPEYGVVFAELKMPGKYAKPKPKQVVWLQALRVAGADVYLWDTSEQAEILDVLSGLGPRGRLFGMQAARA